MTIGWIGTGNMGVRMAERLAKAGHKMYVYNRTASKAQRVLDAGNAALAASPAEVADKCDICFTSVTNDAAMQEVLHGENGLLKGTRSGQILVEMSTLSPAFSQALREELNSLGILYLNAPVVGSMFMIESGLLKILTSGDGDAYRAALPYLRDIGHMVVPLGDSAQARYMKIAVNMMICGYLTLYGEVLLAGEAMGFAWNELNDLLEASDGASLMLRDKGTTHRERVWGSSAALTSTAMKDLGLALEIAEQAQFALPLTAILCQYDRFMSSSKRYCEYSTFGTVGLLEDWCGKQPDDGPAVPEDRKTELSSALAAVLNGVSALLAAEAALFCRKSGIDMKAAVECLGTCHGATVYFKNCLAGQPDTVSVVDVRDALHTVMGFIKKCGVFVPALAVAECRFNQIAFERGTEIGLGSLIQ